MPLLQRSPGLKRLPCLSVCVLDSHSASPVLQRSLCGNPALHACPDLHTQRLAEGEKSRISIGHLGATWAWRKHTAILEASLSRAGSLIDIRACHCDCLKPLLPSTETPLRDFLLSLRRVLHPPSPAKEASQAYSLLLANFLWCVSVYCSTNRDIL